MDTNLRFKVLILTSLEDKYVKYKETIFGSDGNDLKPFWTQNNPKSLKSDLYALTVFFAFELLRFNNVSSCKAFISVIILLLTIINGYRK